MRPSSILNRGAKGYSWYQKFIEKGQDGFKRHVAPTPFDWSKGNISRPRAYFDLNLDNEKLGRLEFELASDVVPKTVEIFKLLCSGKGIKFAGYKSAKLHNIQKGNVIMGGDIVSHNGEGSHSAFNERFFPDENFIIPHTARGLLSMASIGIDTNGSQFYISLGGESTTTANPTVSSSGSGSKHMNGRCVVFGRVSKGEELLDALEKLFTFRGAPARAVTIEDCGIIS